MTKEQDWTPWYRRNEYKGNLNEEEKRHLDSFRLKEKHPAVAFEDLPEEVQGYLTELELAAYDAKQNGVVTKAFLLCIIGGLVILLGYSELSWLSPLYGYVFGSAMIALAWANYSRERKKNADGLWIKQKGPCVPFSRTSEKLQEYWELDEIYRFRKQSEVGGDDLS